MAIAPSNYDILVDRRTKLFRKAKRNPQTAPSMLREWQLYLQALMLFRRGQRGCEFRVPQMTASGKPAGCGSCGGSCAKCLAFMARIPG